MADVNEFKEINDRYGHPMGDRFLVEIARILQKSVRDIDIVCRYAGDEFVIILPDLGAEGCRIVVERIEENMAGFPWGEKLEIPINEISLSIGFAVFPDHARQCEELIEKADRALYCAKKSNKSYCGYQAELEKTLSRKITPVNGDSLPLIGRKRERKELDKILEKTHSGNGHLVLISGEVGIGKTELLAEVEAKGRLKGFEIFRGNCYPETRDIPFHPLIQILEAALKAIEKSGLIQELPSTWQKEALQFLYSGKNENGGSEDLERGLPEDRYQEEFRIYEIFLSFIHTLSLSKPVILSIENLQWADPSSVKLLKYIRRQIRNRRVLICGTFRDKGIGPAEGGEVAIQHEFHTLKKENLLREIPLIGLNDVEIYAMIEKRMGNEKGDRALKEKVLNLSEGNPLFAKEILNYLLREKSDLLVETESWEQVPLDEIIPPNILELFERNLIDLDEEVKSVLSYASVIGNEFDFGILMGISGKNEGHLLDIVDVAVKEGLIQELDRDQGDYYAFTPFLVGRVLYRGLPSEKRRVLHKKIGDLLEMLHAKSLSAYYGVLSFHYQKAGVFQKAVHYATLAGDRARDLYAHTEAVSFYSSALDMLEYAFVPYPHEMAAKLYGKRGRRLFALGKYPQYKDDFQSMITCSREAEDKELEGKALVYLSSSLLTRGNLEEARNLADAALKIGRDIQDQSIMMLAYSDLGGVALYQGAFTEALDHYNASLRLSEAVKDEEAITRNLSNIGVYYWFRKEYDKAVEYYQIALKRLEEYGDKRLLALNLNNLGAVYYVLGKIRESVKAYQESIVLAREIKDKALLAYNYNNLGEIYQALGIGGQAMKYHDDSIQLVKEVGERYVECDILRNIGLDFHLIGKTRKSLRCLKNALRLSRRVGKVSFTLSALFDYGCVRLESGDLDGAVENCDELIRISEEAQCQDALAKAYYLESRIGIARGDEMKTRESLGKLFDLLPVVQDVFFSLRAYSLKWQVLKDREGGKEALARAVAIVRDVVSGLDSRETRESFLNRSDIIDLLNNADHHLENPKEAVSVEEAR
jgi:diguanylate cyclase (GGDEF)-like protein